MADHLRPMEELLRIPILGIEDAIVVPAVLADQFELKPELLDFISNNPFFGLENDDPHSHIKRFYQINKVHDDVVKLILFPFSLKGAAETWLENEPPNSITSWDDLVSNFDIEEKSSGSTTTHSGYSLPDYEAFYFDDDHIEEKSSGSTTTHSDFSIPGYVSFIFNLSIDPLPPADRSDFYHEDFAYELAHIISPPEYDYFYFDLETDPGEFTSVVEKNIFDLSSTKDSTSIELNDFPLLLSDCDSSLSKEFSEIDLLVSFPSGNEDIIFDLGIFIIKGVQSKRFHILSLDDFYPISFVSAPLFLTDPPEIETFLSFPAENEDKVFDPGIFFINVDFSLLQEKLHIF
ncbi:hypothetical protein Tco_0612539 [Tanacetum coccineum]